MGFKAEAFYNHTAVLNSVFNSVSFFHLVKTGMSQYFFWSPKTWAIFFRKPREKPFLSEPVLNTGALKASGVDAQQYKHRCDLINNRAKQSVI